MIFLREHVAALGILPRVLRRGNTLWPTAMALERELALLYGSASGNGRAKARDRQISWFLLNLPSDRYVDTPILSQGLRLLREVILSPIIENGGPGQRVRGAREATAGGTNSLLDQR